MAVMVEFNVVILLIILSDEIYELSLHHSTKILENSDEL